MQAVPKLTGNDADSAPQAAQRTLASACGVNMNTWFVGNHPIGHYIYRIKNARKALTSPESASSTSSPVQAQSVVVAGEKTFFMKGRIMAGQADIQGNGMGIEDFKWLSKDEVQNEVSAQYWASVKNMLVEQ